MARFCIASLLLFTFPQLTAAEETFVTIHKVSGNQIFVAKSSGTGRGMRGGGNAEAGGSAGGSPSGRRGGAAASGGRGRGRFGNTAQTQLATVTVPRTAKITNALRERRTFEFRVMGEIAGGLRNAIFTRMKEPMQARIVSKSNVITEINVISGDTDINQSSTTSSGQNVIAVKPKRPPMKKK